MEIIRILDGMFVGLIACAILASAPKLGDLQTPVADWHVRPSQWATTGPIMLMGAAVTVLWEALPLIMSGSDAASPLLGVAALLAVSGERWTERNRRLNEIWAPRPRT